MNRFIDNLSTYGLFLGIPLLILLIVFWVYRPSTRRRYQDDAQLPFDAAEPPVAAVPPRHPGAIMQHLDR
jgi:cbb3-type cytochrome oxidase subunit 3